jgi:hypothetical protein
VEVHARPSIEKAKVIKVPAPGKLAAVAAPMLPHVLVIRAEEPATVKEVEAVVDLAVEEVVQVEAPREVAVEAEAEVAAASRANPATHPLQHLPPHLVTSPPLLHRLESLVRLSVVKGLFRHGRLRLLRRCTTSPFSRTVF